MQNKKLLNVVGARPQIIKASAISRVLQREYKDSIRELILHTGQHYDHQLSEVFFEELELPLADYNLGVGSARHGKQTALMISGIEEVILNEQPDCVIIYGDTNSTLAAAIAASKLRVPIAHIEAGLRSYRKTMPEEINRVLSDHVSTLLFVPTDTALKNLIKEGLRPDNSPPYSLDNPKVLLSGDIMYDNSLYYAGLAEKKIGDFIEGLGVVKENYVLATIHRERNTDDPDRLQGIMKTFLELASENSMHFVMPLHPRTIHALEKDENNLLSELNNNPYIEIIPPVSYLEMILLEKNARMIITDSGGVQKESHFFSRPCIVLRSETEWVELVNNETAILVDADSTKLKQAFNNMLDPKDLSYPGFYGSGKAAEFIVNEIIDLINSQCNTR